MIDPHAIIEMATLTLGLGRSKLDADFPNPGCPVAMAERHYIT